jgi:uncharacterized membrane protein
VVAVLVVFGILTVLGTLSELLVESIPHLTAGTVPDTDDPYTRNYVLHPWPAALHIVPGFIYLLGAPLQLSARFRRKHLTFHRRLGRVLIPAGMVAAIFALVIGITHPFGGVIEGSATAAFGLWFLTCLTLAFLAVRRRDIARHRRWMIRGFAVAIGIAGIRLWVGVLGAIQSAVTDVVVMSPQQGTYGIAFWLGFSSTVLAGEWWLRRPRS